MPRQRGGARPTARPATRPAAPMQHQRPASTASVPARTAPPPPPAPTATAANVPAQQGSGLFGQMASTAAGVAVGSTVGHMVGAGISGLFGGGSAAAPVEQAAAAAAPAQSSSSSEWGTASCEADAKNFTKCLDENKGDMQICSWYLEQLKACQHMAKTFN